MVGPPPRANLVSMFRRETWVMWAMPPVLAVIASLAALVVPSYLGRARIAACEKSGRAWDTARHKCAAPPDHDDRFPAR